MNLEAAEEICRQLRLRNMGGLIVLDFIDMKSRRDQQQVYPRMNGLRRDKAKTHILPISPRLIRNNTPNHANTFTSLTDYPSSKPNKHKST